MYFLSVGVKGWKVLKRPRKLLEDWMQASPLEIWKRLEKSKALVLFKLEERQVQLVKSGLAEKTTCLALVFKS